MRRMKLLIRQFIFLYCMFLGLFFFPDVSYANSSWHWVTYSPAKLLPIAVALTLVIESSGLVILGGLKKHFGRVFMVVTLANVASFILPYIERSYRFLAVAGDLQYAWFKAFNSGPYYMVLIGYLILTLLVEMPLVYYLLRNYSESKRSLLITIVVVNIITTIAVGGLERLLCQGQW